MVYLDNAATTRYIPAAVIKEYIARISAKCNPSRGSYRDAVELGLNVYRVRESIKRHLNAPSHEVVFCKNCTEALNLGILGYLSERGGRVVTTVTEHNSVLRPLRYLEQKGKIRYTAVSPSKRGEGVRSSDVAAAISSDVRLVVVNAVSNVTGIPNDIEGIGALCSQKGIPFLVDGAQGLGHLPLNVAKCGIDMLAAPAHKGLHGLQGGFLLTNRQDLTPLLYGGTGTKSLSLEQPLGVEGWEAGTQDNAGICALGKGVEWTYRHLDKIRTHEDKLIGYLSDELTRMGEVKAYGYGNGILAFALRGAPSSWVGDRLDEMGIAVRVGLHCAPLMHRYLGTTKEGLVRVSVGYDTATRDIDRLLYALDSLLAER